MVGWPRVSSRHALPDGAHLRVFAVEFARCQHYRQHDEHFIERHLSPIVECSNQTALSRVISLPDAAAARVVGLLGWMWLSFAHSQQEDQAWLRSTQSCDSLLLGLALIRSCIASFHRETVFR